MGLKQSIKQAVQRRPFIWSRYQQVKQLCIRTLTASYYLYDIQRTWRHMYWSATGTRYWALSAELLFQYHKLEKGMVMPGTPRLFGTDPVRATMSLLSRWEDAGHAIDDPIYLGALVTVQCYEQHLTRLSLDSKSAVIKEVRSFICQRQDRISPVRNSLQTPYPLPSLHLADGGGIASAFEALSLSRRSVREFQDLPVPLHLVERAIDLASLSPTACNRQPNKVVLLQGRHTIDQALEFQNGNRGFGHTVPLLGVLVVDTSGYFDGSERNQPYVDGGLFAMSLMLALRAMGLGSCSLNWCVTPNTDRRFRQLGHVRPEETVTMMLAIGYPLKDAVVPRSPRRAHAEVVRIGSML